jgi:hypothetical protein
MNGGNSTSRKSVVNDANISDKYIEQANLYHPSMWAWPALFPGREWCHFSKERESENSLINLSLKRFKTHFTECSRLFGTQEKYFKYM